MELSAALTFPCAVGAIASSCAVSACIAARGPAAMFPLLALAHVLLVLFGLVRMRARLAETRTRHVDAHPAPRSSTAGWLAAGPLALRRGLG